MVTKVRRRPKRVVVHVTGGRSIGVRAISVGSPSGFAAGWVRPRERSKEAYQAAVEQYRLWIRQPEQARYCQ
jgi:hypothetical protein